jgi:hypothetical protein
MHDLVFFSIASSETAILLGEGRKDSRVKDKLQD